MKLREITPWKINGWFTYKMIFQTSMIMFHVNLQGCKYDQMHVSTRGIQTLFSSSQENPWEFAGLHMSTVFCRVPQTFMWKWLGLTLRPWTYVQPEFVEPTSHQC